MTYLYPYPSYSAHPAHIERPRHPSPAMQVYVPVAVPLVFDGGAFRPTVMEGRDSGEHRRHSGDRRSLDRPDEHGRRSRDRERREPRELRESRDEGTAERRRSERSERSQRLVHYPHSPRLDPMDTPQHRYRRDRTEPGTPTLSVSAETGSHLGSRHTRVESARSTHWPHPPRTLRAPRPVHPDVETHGDVSSSHAAPPPSRHQAQPRSSPEAHPPQTHRPPVDRVEATSHCADCAHDDVETRRRARLTLRWVRALMPGLPPPEVTPPLSPNPPNPPTHPASPPHSPPPDYFVPHPQEVQPGGAPQLGQPPPPRPGFRRQSSWGDYVRKLAPSLPNMPSIPSMPSMPSMSRFGWRAGPPPAYAASPEPRAAYPEAQPPTPPPKLHLCTGPFSSQSRPPSPAPTTQPEPKPPPVPPPPKIYVALAQPAPPPERRRTRRRDHSPGRILDSVTAAFRPRKVRFADGGAPGSSVIGGG